MQTIAKHCKNCAHSIFCPTWGEYKCLKHEIRKHDPTKTCEEYSEVRDKKEKPCRCEDCEERIFEDDT